MDKAFLKSKWITFGRGKNEYRSKINPWCYQITPEIHNEDIQDGIGIPVFCKRFKLNPDILKCTIRLTALGCFNLYVNGNKIGNDELMPGWTDYNKRVMYYTYDITEYVHEDYNAIAVPVSLGWWGGRISLDTYDNNDLAFICEIEVQYLNSAMSYICSDLSWKGTLSGPVRYADIWDGEVYNANFDSYEEMSMPSYPQNKLWKKPFEFLYFKGEISPVIGPTVKIRDFLKMYPVSATKYDSIINNNTDFGEIGNIKVLKENFAFSNIKLKKSETIIFDMGQNMVGWVHFVVKGKNNSVLTLRHGEMINDSGSLSRGNDGPKGSIYTENYRSAKAKVKYTLRGDKSGEEYRPSFTFFGFRYIELKATEDIEIINFFCDVVGSDIIETGKIITSNDDVNKLFNNVLWGQRSNYLSVPSDCPQRDESLGWAGDTQIFANTAAYNADVRLFFHKWLQDAADSQNSDGEYSDVIPSSRMIKFGGAGWADAGIIVPYVIYTMYGDVEIIKKCYSSMYDYMSWLSNSGFEGARQTYGDWLAYEPTENRYISIAYYAYTALLFSKMSGVISSFEDDIYDRRSKEFKNLFNKICKHFQSIYIDESGDLKQDSQTAYLLALKFGLVPDELCQKYIGKLSQKIIDNGYKLSTGFLGTGILPQTLSEIGLGNLAYSLLLQTDDPSWLYSVYQGATTVWERWNSYTIANGFGSVGMNSFNHYAYGAVVEWMYKYMLGIYPDEKSPGFKHIIFKPIPDTRKAEELPLNQKQITWAKGEYNSVSGLIRAEWNIDDQYFNYKVSVPHNSSATLYLPLFDKSTKFIYLNREEIMISEFDISNNSVVISLPSGDFELKIKV